MPDEQKDRPENDFAERGVVIKEKAEENFYNMDVFLMILSKLEFNGPQQLVSIKQKLHSFNFQKYQMPFFAVRIIGLSEVTKTVCSC